jgi:dTDP-glucose pyrophosphorylase
VIPAGGSGVRFRELGKMYPKCTLPHEGRAIIWHIAQFALYTEPKAVYIAVLSEEQKRQIEECLVGIDDSRVQVIVARDEQYLPGPATTLYSAIKKAGLGDEPVFVMLSDGFVDNWRFYRDFVALGRSGHSLIAVDDIGEDGDPSRWCMVEVDRADMTVVNFSDKPKKSALRYAAAGYYYIQSAGEYTRCYFDTAFLSGEPQFSDVFASMMKDGHKFKAPVYMIEPLRESVMDFGTLEAYMANRGIYKSRSFNTIELTADGTVIKQSVLRPNKIAAEAGWLRCSPLRAYGPRVLEESYGTAGCYIEMDRCSGILLRDVYLYMDRSTDTWRRVFEQTAKFFEKCRRSSNDLAQPAEFWLNYQTKNKQRLDRLTRVANFPAFNAKRKLEELLLAHHERLEDSVFFCQSSLFHGDLHFGNMFYDLSGDKLQLIDPRGEIYGHWVYDLAKLLHSLLGRYDFIDAQFYRSVPSTMDAVFYDKNVSEVLEAFMATEPYASLSQDEQKLILEMTAFLFLTMIPLHTDNQLNQRLMYNEFWRLLELSNAH